MELNQDGRPFPIDPGENLNFQEGSPKMQFLNLLSGEASKRIDEQLFKDVRQFEDWFRRSYSCERRFEAGDNTEEAIVTFTIEDVGHKKHNVKMIFEIPAEEDITRLDQITLIGVHEIT